VGLLNFLTFRHLSLKFHFYPFDLFVCLDAVPDVICFIIKHEYNMTHGGVDVQLYVFLTSALDGSEWSAWSSGRFIIGVKVAGIHWAGKWLGPRAGLDLAARTEIPATGRKRSLAVQPV